MPTNNIIIIAIGELYRAKAKKLIDSLLHHGCNDPITCITDVPFLDKITHIIVDPGLTEFESRQIKTQLSKYTESDLNLYLDADIEVNSSINGIWDQLGDSQIAMATEDWHGTGFHGALSHSFAAATEEYQYIKNLPPDKNTPYFNASVMLWRKNDTTSDFFAKWHNEWTRFRKTDQTALFRVVSKFNIDIKELKHPFTAIVGANGIFYHSLYSVGLYCNPMPELGRIDAIIGHLPNGPASAVEVGIFRGRGSAGLLTRKIDLELTMIDQWKACVEGDRYSTTQDGVCKYSQAQMELFYFQSKFLTAPYETRRTILRTSSLDASIALEKCQFDLVFIDAEHSCEAVQEDIRAWYPLVKPHGWIGGHDYGLSKFPGVRKAVDDFVEKSGLTLELDIDATWFVRKK